VRQEAFAAVLEGLELGAYDRQIVNWLTSWDDPTCRTIASLMWRCRLAGATAAPGSVVLAPADDLGQAGTCQGVAARILSWSAERDQ
jgi:hypothetical protein